MNAETFLENFGHLADAPAGVPKLREMVVELAVQGNLVEQDANDEPATLLLDRAAEEKRRLISKGQLRKTKPVGSVTDDEKPFDIPQTWAWTRLQDVGIVNPRNDVEDDLVVSFTPMALISEKYGAPPQFEERRWRAVKSGFTHFAEHDVVMAKITPCFQNRKSAVMRGLHNRVGAGTTELHVFRPLSDTLLPEYVLIFLKSPRFVEDGVSKMTGSAGQKRVPKDYFAKSPFPVPPLGEQHRIVAKVDELMALCDELEARQQERRTVHVHLNAAALDRLTSAANDTDFTAAWTRVRSNFDLLYSVPENVTALRQAILQLAVQGKLVEQDPDDEPAADLLSRVARTRKEFVNAGQAKKHKPMPPIDRDSFNHRLPSHCGVIRLGDLLTFGPSNGVSPKPADQPTATKSLTLSATTKGVFDPQHVKFLAEQYPRDSPLWLEDGDILIQRSNTEEYVGVSAVYHSPSNQFVYPDLMMKLRVVDEIDVNFIHVVLSSRESRDYWRQRATGTSGSMRKINQATVCSLPVPIPPVEEQNRILRRVQELMSLCEELESKLTQQHADADRLTEAMVAAILDGAAA